MLEVVVGQQPSQEEVQKAWAKYSILLLALLPTGKPSVAVAFALVLAGKKSSLDTFECTVRLLAKIARIRYFFAEMYTKNFFGIAVNSRYLALLAGC